MSTMLSPTSWTYEKLLSELLVGRGESAAVRAWFKRRFKGQAPNWAQRLSGLARFMVAVEEVPTTWDRAPQHLRDQRAKRVKRLAEALAAELQREPRLPSPDLLAMLDDDSAKGIIDALRPGTLRLGLAHAGLPKSRFRDVPILRHEADNWSASAIILADCVPGPRTELSSMLHRLAEFAEHSASAKRSDARPRTGTPDVRVMSRKLSQYFESAYGVFSDATVAHCLAIYWPDLLKENPPTARDVKNWRHSGSKPAAR